MQKPLQTLQKADSLVQPGDTVWIMAGTYRNTSKDQGGGTSSLLTITRSGTSDKWITWRAYKNDRPELIAQGCWQCIELKASYIAIEGLTLTGNNDNVRLIDAERNGEVNVKATYAAWRAEGSLTDADFSATPNLDKDKPGTVPAPKPVAKPAAKPKSRPVTYEEPSPLYNGNGITVDCRGNRPFFHHFRLKDLVVRKFGTVGIAMMSTDYYTIENCEVYENAWYSRYGGSGISQLGGRSFDEKPGYHNIIRNNRVYNNKGLVRVYYLGMGLISDGNGIILDSLVNYPGAALVENNLSYGNGGSGIHIFKSHKAPIDVVNNTIWGNQQNWRLYEMGAHDAVNIRFLNNVVVADKYRQVNG
ncbi:MAG: right-handed parallel beta-helix repeat-containing protein, partial [Armatimonadota bacterium]